MLAMGGARMGGLRAGPSLEIGARAGCPSEVRARYRSVLGTMLAFTWFLEKYAIRLGRFEVGSKKTRRNKCLHFLCVGHAIKIIFGFGPKDAGILGNEGKVCGLHGLGKCGAKNPTMQAGFRTAI